METVRAPLPPPDVKWHRHDREYTLSLLERAKLSQRGAAKLLGLNERTMRYYCSGEQETPYPVQYALEVLAAAGSSAPGVQERKPCFGTVPAGAWFEIEARPITKEDAGKIIVALDRTGSLLAGRVVADGFGVMIHCVGSGVDSNVIPVEVVRGYALLDPPEVA